MPFIHSFIHQSFIYQSSQPTLLSAPYPSPFHLISIFFLGRTSLCMCMYVYWGSMLGMYAGDI